MSQQHTCNVCNESFNSEEQLREHQRNAAHVVGKKGNESGKEGDRKENERPGSQQSGNQQQPQHRKEDKIAS